MIADGFSILVAIGDLACKGIDGHVERSGKCGSALDVTIADEPNDFALGKNRGFVVERTVAKMDGQASGHPISMADLNQIGNAKGLAVQRLHRDEAMKGSLGAADWNRVSGERLCRDKSDAK